MQFNDSLRKHFSYWIMLKTSFISIDPKFAGNDKPVQLETDFKVYVVINKFWKADLLEAKKSHTTWI